jgi:nucleotide-binding universal stress UspA family protein
MGTTDAPTTSLWGHIACCLDESEAAAGALREARRLRAQGQGRLTLLHVAHGPPHDATPPCPAWLEAAASESGGHPVVLLNLGAPAAAVTEWAAAARVDLIVASASRGMRERILLGSFAGYLARHAPCSVLLTRP